MEDPFSLEGRTALVTGASRGIGAATAKALDARGARVALAARSSEAMREVSRELSNAPVVIEADLSVPSAPGELASRVLDTFGHLDILVNNAAAAVRLPTVETDGELVDSLLAVNVRAPLLLVAALIPSMTKRKSGSVVNLSSVSGLVGTPRRAAYAATKGAIDAMTRSLAMELGPLGIRVNSVAPGVVDTALWEKNKRVPGVVDGVERQTPLRRWGQPDDIADVICFLASDAARFVTGEVIAADGGMGATLDLYAGGV